MSYIHLIKKGLPFSSLFVSITLVTSLILTILTAFEPTVQYLFAIIVLCHGHFGISGPLAAILIRKELDKS